MPRRSGGLRLVLFLALALGGGAALAWWSSWPGRPGRGLGAPATAPVRDPAPAGRVGPSPGTEAGGTPTGPIRSAALRATRVLATANEPSSPHANAIWCASLELAWRELGHGQFGGPIRVVGDRPMASRLGAAPAIDLAEEHWYAGSGPRDADVIARVVEGLVAKFPEALAPPAIQPGDGYFALAYLEAAFQFTHPYLDVDPIEVPPLTRAVTDPPPSADGPAVDAYWDRLLKTSSAYKAFGIPPRPRKGPQRAQAALLHADLEPDRDEDGAIVRQPDLTYVVDLDRKSAPFQLLLAKVPAGPTLADTWDGVARRLAWSAARRRGAQPPPIAAGDTLTVPCFAWDIEHTFAALRGARIVNAGFTDQHIDEVYQRTKFRLDKAGVEMKSIAVIVSRGMHHAWSFKPPFLIALRQRGAERPFFLFWVANEELLVPADG